MILKFRNRIGTVISKGHATHIIAPIGVTVCEAQDEDITVTRGRTHKTSGIHLAREHYTLQI